jgi:hypothetical protein
MSLNQVNKVHKDRSTNLKEAFIHLEKHSKHKEALKSLDQANNLPCLSMVQDKASHK